jgi:predicted RNase H-like HicB family nuclease
MQVVSFGKLSFYSNELLPESTETSKLNVLIFKHLDDNGIYTHSAVCIELEIDACGNSEKEACQKLQEVITMYFQSLAQQSKTAETFVKSVIDIVFSESQQKRTYLSCTARQNKNTCLIWHKKMHGDIPL